MLKSNDLHWNFFILNISKDKLSNFPTLEFSKGQRVSNGSSYACSNKKHISKADNLKMIHHKRQINDIISKRWILENIL